MIADAGPVLKDLYNSRYPPRVGVALDSDGNGMVVWAREKPGAIQASRSTTRSAWDEPSTISLIPDRAHDDPTVAFDAHGNAVAVWGEGSRCLEGLATWANRFEARAGWATAQRIQPNASACVQTRGRGLPNPLSAFVAADPAGNAMGFWNQSKDTSLEIYPNGILVGLSVAEFSPAGGWREPLALSSPGNYRGGTEARAATSADGSGFVVWSAGDVFSARREPSGRWTGVERLASPARTPDVAAYGSGSALAAWVYKASFFPRVDQIMASRFEPGQGWSAPEKLWQGVAATGPRLAANSRGEAVLLWTDDNFSLWASRCAPGSGWTSPDLIVTGAVDPVPAFDDSGHALVLLTLIPVQSDVRAIRFDPKTGWSTPEPLARPDSLFLGSPSLAADARGNAIAAWSQCDSTDTVSIWARRFVAP